MAEQEKVTLVAYSGLSDPNVDHTVERGEEFETTPELAKVYLKANWAGPPGVNEREIQLEVAAEEVEQRKEAKKHATEGRKLFRNLSRGSFERGNAAAVGVMPGTIETVDEPEQQRTNRQKPKASSKRPDQTEEGNE